MEVTIIDCTTVPLNIISRAAGTSTGKDDIPRDRVERCFNDKHLSVFEHAHFTARIEGISRACSHQLVRHRMASFVQESQRYSRVNADDQFDSNDWYVIPPDIAYTDIMDSCFHNTMKVMMYEYCDLIARGIKLEDARYVLPEATKTNITMTMNCRELFHFLDLRLDEHAQWEIRDLAQCIVYALEDEGSQWHDLMTMYLDSRKEGIYEP